MPNYTNSVWSETPPAPRHRPLDGNVSVDVAIVGGGITGITAARLLEREGRRVAVLESRRLGKGESSKTTAHVTEVLDVRYHRLVSRFGKQGARLAALAQRAAIDRIAAFVAEDGIACDLQRVPGFLYAETPDDVDDLREEARVARRLGVHAQLVSEVPLPFPVAGAVRFDDQAQLQPRAYLLGLAAGLQDAGRSVFEETHVLDVEEGSPCRVLTENGVVYAHDVIVAAHVPVSNRFLVHAKLAAYRTYVLGVAMPLEDPIGLYWDTADPYHFVRSHTVDGVTYLLVGGEDHKVGDADDTAPPFRRLEAYVRQRFGRSAAPTDFRWSGQIVVSADGLPYIGRNALSSRVFVASGYGGNGVTQGTLAGMMLADEVRGVPNPYADLFAATRFKPLASARAVLSENVDFPRHLLADRLPQSGPSALASLGPGEGRVITMRGERLAVYRNGNGELSALSPVCTHLGCLVHWNTTELSWDCPCHGSRFDPHGRILNGPAVAPLEARPLPDLEGDGVDEAEDEDELEPPPARGPGHGLPV
jgi:glycine/D-amino acid oxidase-like deaminating enzyme/nitrite reductase/ring-hydroxylating ferredoxin subunit